MVINMINRIFKIFLCCIFIGVLTSNMAYAQNTVYEYYVAPNGDDAADGSIVSPFRTIERAKSKIRDLREKGIEELYRKAVECGIHGAYIFCNYIRSQKSGVSNAV